MHSGDTDQDQLTFLLAEHPASPSLSPDSEEDWMTRVVTWRSSLPEWLTTFARAGSSGKMSPVSLVRTEGGTLLPSSGRFQNSGIVAPGGSWTLNTSECPSVVVECSLSQVLETGAVPQRYFLSPKACAGILRRAAKRAKKLPWALEMALKKAASLILLALCAVTLTLGLIAARMPTQAALFLMLGGGGLPQLSRCLNAGGMGRQDYETETLIPIGGFFEDAVTQYGDKAGALTARHDSSPCADRGQNIVTFAENSRGEVRLENGDGQRTGTISHGGGKPGQGYPAIAGSIGVRRLTPTECERLQGFPDGHTLVEHRGKPAADGPRYKAIGNSMAVPVMRWIGKRIAFVDKLI